jgi:hypothetical protein
MDSHETRIARLETLATELQTQLAKLQDSLKTADRGKGKKVSAALDCDEADAQMLPANLDTKRFRPIWQDFCKHRRALCLKGTVAGKKYPWTARGAQGVLRKCLAMGEPMAIASLEQSMEKGWADIYEVKDAPQSSNGRGGLFEA